MSYDYDELDDFVDNCKHSAKTASDYICFSMLTIGFGLLLIAAILIIAK